MKIVGMAQIYNEITSGRLKRCLDHYRFSSQRKLMDRILNYMRLDTTRDYLSVLNGEELSEINI